MKKYLFLATILLLFHSCDYLTLNEAQRNAKQYTIERINASLALSMDDVDNIEVAEKPDTIISSIVITMSMVEVYAAQAKYHAGEMSYDSLTILVDDIFKRLTDVYLVAQYQIDDSLKAIYSDELRLSYPVTVRMKSGTTRNVSVVMDRDGIKPYIFRHKIVDDLETNTNILLDALRK